MFLGCKAEAARGGERQRPGTAGDLTDDESEIAAAQPLFEREQRVLGIFRRDMDQTVAQRVR